jgi:hypothetical protein
MFLLLAAQGTRAQTTLHLWYGDLGEQDDFGASVAVVGDVDGDGHDDVLVGVPYDDFWQGSARLYSGLDGHEIRRWESTKTHDRLGWSVAAAGDLDGDGTPDVLVGAIQRSIFADTWVGPGYVDVYSGASGALIRRLNGPSYSTEYGHWVRSLGDIDGDGVPELGIGGPGHDGVEENTGLADIRSGADFSLLKRAEGTVLYDQMGRCVRAAGDVDADGHPDVLVGAPSAFGLTLGGHVYVYSGADWSLVLSVDGGALDVELGTSLAALGDVDGDGHDDFAAGGPGKDKVMVFSGASGDVLYTLSGGSGTDLGTWVEPAGDLDGDGITDLVASAPNDELPPAGSPDEQGSVAFLSGADGSTLWKLYGGGGLFGHVVDLSGDLDGDGLRDLVVGAPMFYDLPEGETGRVEAFSIHPWLGLGQALAGTPGAPSLWGHGSLAPGSAVGLELGAALPSSWAAIAVGLSQLQAPFKGGVLVPFPDLVLDGLATDGIGSLSLATVWPTDVPSGGEVVFQAWIDDPGALHGWAASNGLLATTP